MEQKKTSEDNEEIDSLLKKTSEDNEEIDTLLSPFKKFDSVSVNNHWKITSYILTLTVLILSTLLVIRSKSDEENSSILCWDEEVFGPTEYAPTFAMCRRSRRTIGYTKGLSRKFLANLDAGLCTKSVAIGGSVTCGHKLADGKARAWPAQFENWLNHFYPCAGGRHEVLNLCQPAIGTAQWVTKLANNKDIQVKIASADVIFVDTDVNDHGRPGYSMLGSAGWLSPVTHEDVIEPTPPSERPIGKFTEVLLLQLRHLVGIPAPVVFVTPSFRLAGSNVSGSAAETLFDDLDHSAVLRYYSVPEVSTVSALWPLQSEAAKNWTKHLWLTDNDKVHPKLLGHQFMAELLGFMVRQELVHLHEQGSSKWEVLHSWDQSRKPLYVAAVDTEVWISSNSLLNLQFTTQEALETKGLLLDDHWSLYSDVPDKPGLITMSTNSSLTLSFTAGRRGKVTVVTVSMLKSYRAMGTLHAEIVQHKKDFRSFKTVAVADVDCLWNIKTSIASDTYLSFKPLEGMEYKLKLHTRPSQGLTRARNKIKLLGITINSVA
eukprot:CAMPEP_0194268000 /NCGR_PEP_ID=MMETSP0169-20130528/2382_1 /TAXON_ID=218684 /ORGANISM="Corethron pennatum, Strain L29A3" /LENGTH=545 /DNA_ID=CAMNT_0039009037 /DNA_START=27 /DNA_END=1664 /DNA_ORIENTATION=-